ncbi:MAG: (d)CMP kinase [Alphaproteobacteria bacterium]|nr:(d)CMP kinase [Alphaproteobacteria bacterium]
MNKIITIDGPAASGKGTLARELAEALGYAYMDTGALYRAVGYEVLQAGGDPEDEADALKGCRILAAKLGKDGIPVLSNPDLRMERNGDAASKVAIIQSVRDALLDIQRNFADNPGDKYKGAVLDGRDIGTVICPDAPLKLYITASDEIRAQRRMKELHSKGISVTKSAVLEDMRARDARDKARKVAPMRPAEDAIVIDTSVLDAGQVLETALKYVSETLA